MTEARANLWTVPHQEAALWGTSAAIVSIICELLNEFPSRERLPGFTELI
jgi:hypothetical protein